MPNPARQRRVLLWSLATFLTLGAAAWQRWTGPSHPFRASYAWRGATYRARFARSAVTTEDARVEVPAPPSAAGTGADEGATLAWRRYPTDDPFTSVPLARDGDVLAAAIPRQPAAGKVEYHVVLRGDGEDVLLPSAEEGEVVLRYRDPVPAWLLIPHIAAMFLAILFGIRAALAAGFEAGVARRWTLRTLGVLTLGGLVLGPLVQRHAFGQLWTGWPNGYDLTDNKTLFMWLGWLIAAIAVVRSRGPLGRARRAVVIGAALLMLVVYGVPHSARGSQLDYQKLPGASSPTDAIGTG